MTSSDLYSISYYNFVQFICTCTCNDPPSLFFSVASSIPQDLKKIQTGLWTVSLPKDAGNKCITIPLWFAKIYYLKAGYYPRRRRGHCIWVCLSIRLSVCLSAQNFHVFLRNRLSDWAKIFTIGGTTHEECFNDNYDIIGQVVWQPYWKNFGPLYLWNRTKEKNLTLAHRKYSSWEMSLIFFMMS